MEGICFLLAAMATNGSGNGACSRQPTREGQVHTGREERINKSYYVRVQ